MSEASPQILGDKYRLIRPLDKGGMGSVWLAEHLALASPVAIKLITADVAKTADRLQRFLREARAAAAARSPHVVQVLDYGVHDGTPYIVMELLEGESLAERLHRRGRIGPSETETVIRHVSRAVTRAHDAGIVHRDLKPANIFITHNEEEEVVKIFDFGIAKASEGLGGGAGGGLGKATRTGSFLGTPYYMSPEQLEGGRRCDYRADIWAMGVIAFECLLGRLPFSGQGIGGLVLSICSHPLPVPSQLGEVPEGFDAWFARACCRDLDGRFGSAREAAQDLRRVLGASFGLEPSFRAVASSHSDLLSDDRALLEPAPPLSHAELERADARQKGGQTVAIGAPAIGMVAIGAHGAATPGGSASARLTPAGAISAGIPPAGVAGSAPAGAADAAKAREVAARELPSTTTAPSSATLDREQAPRRPHPLVLAAPIVACAAIALALQGVRGSTSAPDPRATTEGVEGGPAATEAAGPATPPATARLVVLGQGAHLRASVDGQDIGPVPCEVQGVVAGDHTVVISGDARYRPSHTRVHLEPGGEATVGPVKLEVEKGLATVVAGEGAGGAELSLSVGDSTLSLPSLPVQLDVETAQVHVLHARKPGFAPLHLPLGFEDGQAQKTFTVALTPLPKDEPAAKKPTKAKGRRPSARRRARVAARSTQADAPRVAAKSTFTFTATPEASVLLDGAPLGTTPLHDVAVEPGSHRVIFIHGEQRKAMLVVGISGQEKLVTANFRPARQGP